MNLYKNLFDRLTVLINKHIMWPIWSLIFVFYDTWRYIYHSGMLRLSPSIAQRNSRILAACHVLEKGLSFPEPKRAYGAATAKFICYALNSKRHNPSSNVESIACGVLLEYKKYHDIHNFNIGTLSEDIKLVTDSKQAASAGIKTLSSKSFLDDHSFTSILRNRKSVRDFSNPPQAKQIEDAVELAINTPSACNRQSWRVYWIRNKEKCHILAKAHSGSRGFGDSIPAWLIVTVDIASFQGPRERWAAYVDGGMFAMNLLLSLTEVGLASCPLNWSTSPINDYRIHKQLAIPHSETIIMLIAVGMPSDKYDVPISGRLPLSDILRRR